MAVTNVGRISGPLLKANLTRTSDLAFETDLLFIGHTNGRIGIKNDAPTRDFEVTGDARYTGDLIATNSASFGNLEIDGTTSTFSTLTGPINMNATTNFQMTELRTGNLAFTNSGIRAYNGENIEIEPGPGTGIVVIPSDLNTTGNIHATGDITFDGNIFIGGDGPEDTLSFNGDIESDLIPDVTGTYDIGSDSQRWGDVHVGSMTGLNDIVVDNTISLSGVRVNLGIENKWYVSTNGADNLAGNHPNFAFGTIRHALQYIEESTAGPHELHILPGTYTEQFPLEVPANVTVKGAGIRSVTVKPNVPGRYQDAFLMNDASSVTDLTVKNFHYSSSLDRGYGFRFAPNAGIVTKSPYIQNVTVITQGDTRTATDPRGFDSGDAGRGAVVDGSVLDTASPRASMLFNAVTFITPGADGIILKNQSRAEIIDCFTYFANTSIKLESGSEARIIASASVYGNKGITADGVGTKCYAISHNFAYVGTGKDVENDESLWNQNNETEETNSGRVYFVSQDQSGDFRVGDNFIVDLAKGTTSISVNEGDLGGSTLTVGVQGRQTLVDATKIDVPNFRISDNRIQTLNDGLTISAVGSNNVNFNANVLMPNVDVSGNATIGGSGINFGNEAGDTVDFAMDFEQDLLPTNNTQSNIGSPTKNWKTTNSARITLDNIDIHNNTIQTTDTNSQLELRANGTGKVNLEDVGFKTTVTSAQGVAPADAEYNNGALISENNGTVFNRALTVNGLKLVVAGAVGGQQAVPDEWAKKTARVVELMTDPNGAGINTTHQRNFIKTLRGDAGTKHAGIPTVQRVAYGGGSTYTPNWLEDAGIPSYAGLQAFNDSVAQKDMVWYRNISGPNPPTQRGDIEEIFEHIFHTIHAFGIPGAVPGSADAVEMNPDIRVSMEPSFDWQNTAIHLAMKEVIDAGLYDPSGYATDWNTDPEKAAVAYTEYTYLINWSMWDMSQYWDGGSLSPEWDDSLKTPAGMLANNPLGYSLFNTYFAPVLSKPNFATIESIFGNNDTGVSGYVADSLVGGSQGDVAFSAGGDTTIIDTTSHILLPSGTTAQNPDQGNAIRFDNTINEFELFSTGKIALNGIKDGDRDTYIDLSNNKFTFYADNNSIGEIDGAGNLIVNSFSSQDQFAIDGRTVSVGSAANAQAGFTANGTGKVVLDTANLSISGGVIENSVTDADITFTGLGTKQNRTVQFDSVNGYVGPFGTQVERDATIPRLGAVWFNTDNGLLEVYAGAVDGWVSSIGVQAVTVTEEIANDLNVVYNLILN
jgi:hypothetical protein